MQKRLIFSLVVILVCGFAIFAFAQRAAHPQEVSSDVDARTVTNETGELILKYTITVKSTLPKNAVIGCTGSAIVDDSTGGTSESATGVATLVSGTTYTCSAIIHYSWELSTPTTDKITLGGKATIDYGYQLSAFNGTGTVVEPIELRSSTPTGGEISVPANGATTTEDINVTL